ncbi:MAG: polymer-forming cytoskeletal protein [Hyphomicrobiales bacterium]|nr:polymer-forming cytoskeletal protein [Hyphomicrobiales bacterium]MCY4033533.1 polymer-forming cytoskeletal protein [Hyphomicrobiales bacterium]MCY4039443.1 polymer-forming cytoskeletal protein [Hyphomicrobiales bacterium]
MLFRKTRKENRISKSLGEADRNETIPSLISADLCITGDVVSNGEVHIEGKIEGVIRVKHLTIGEKAQIIGSVTGNDVVISGRVSGDVRANKLHLGKNANVEGDLEHNSLSMEAGATLEGKCHRVNKSIDPNANGSSQTQQTRKQKTDKPIMSV